MSLYVCKWLDGDDGIINVQHVLCESLYKAFERCKVLTNELDGEPWYDRYSTFSVDRLSEVDGQEFEIVLT